MTRNGVKEKLVELLTEKEIRHRMFEERLHVFKGRRRIPDELFLEEEKLVIPRLIEIAYSDIMELSSQAIGKDYVLRIKRFSDSEIQGCGIGIVFN